MTVRYALKRRDIWEAYWFSWRNSWKLKGAQIIIAACAFLAVHSWLTRSNLSSSAKLGVALTGSLVSILWLPVYPLLRYKPEPRMLTITPEGITTAIGERSGSVPWKAVDRIEVRDQRLYVVGKSGNAFLIPSSAFDSLEEHQRFATQAASWWRAQSGT